MNAQIGEHECQLVTASGTAENKVLFFFYPCLFMKEYKRVYVGQILNQSEGLFRCRNFWQNDTVVFSLLFDN